jgi:hypothetical protein
MSDRGAAPVGVGDLGEGLVGVRDVIGGSVGSGVAGPQQPGHGALVTEKTTLQRRVQQLTQEHRKLQERLEGARSNLCFADKRIADLEAQLLEQDQP